LLLLLLLTVNWILGPVILLLLKVVDGLRDLIRRVDD